jgi:hypothetical protein
MRLRAGACSIMAVSLAMAIWHAQAQTAAQAATIAASRQLSLRAATKQ